jgi:DNA invertase Pin-like site-specific DNA recombinase
MASASMRPLFLCLVEQADRLSRVTSADWEKLKAELTARRVRVVALDLLTSWMMSIAPTRAALRGSMEGEDIGA